MTDAPPTAPAPRGAPAGTTPAADGYGLLRGPRQIVFGAGQRHGLGPVVAGLGSRALVCTDRRMAGQEEFRTLLDGLRRAVPFVEVYDDVQPELPVAGLVDCVAKVAGHRPDVVVGIGGGSCIDHAKVVSLLLVHGGRPADYYGEFAVPGPALPVVAVPTTAGTGSEATAVAVLADPERATKVGISSPYLIPDTAIVDPELSRSCPPGLTAHTAADALTHCVESFTAIRRTPEPGLARERVFVGKSLLTDTYALAGTELIGRSIVAAVRDGADAAARHDLQLGALYGGLALSTAGTAAAHALQYPIGALTHTPHGVGVGALLPYVMAYNLPARVPEFAQLAAALGCSGDGDGDGDGGGGGGGGGDDRGPGAGDGRAGGDGDSGGGERARARAAVERVAELLAAVGIPRTLDGLGLTAGQLATVAEQGMNAARLVQNNPRPLDAGQLGLIVDAAFEGDLDGLLRTAVDEAAGAPVAGQHPVRERTRTRTGTERKR
ncbi:iron-containing alcohol dehydrogenase [Streptomyces sp. TS71-3]|uniref:iron-containing alcohol dehydrogenase n=1 Tax=Streptomyces sp. TS71-3 TaxID=2733862 RepID=UPI001B2B70F7|nr:iron-containing alcohol dehydrogenase [Streptomyces sp. TS71-3]GHJ40915.1 alcohol dehydrogenase [Streptomyces sp. TS71-3]